MKKLYALLCPLLLATYLKTQTPVLHTLEDAYTLSGYLTTINKPDSLSLDEVNKAATFFQVFAKYAGIKNIDRATLLKNPFIREQDIPASDKPIKKKISASNGTLESYLNNNHNLENVLVSGTTTTSSSITPSWQTAVIDGTARFLSKRFKQEMAAWYLNTLHDKIKDISFLQKLFPKTISFLDVFANQVYNTDIALLQAAAEKDIQNLPSTLFVAAKEIEPFKTKPLLLNTLHMGVDLYTTAKRGTSLADMINTLPTQEYVDETLKKYLCVLRIISNGLQTDRNNPSKGPWQELGEYDFTDLEDQTVRFFYALLFEQLKTIKISDKTFGELLTGSDIASVAQATQNLIGKFRDLNQFIEQQIALMKTKEPDYLGALAILSETTGGFITFLKTLPKPVPVPEEITTAVKCLPAFYDMSKAVSSKQFTKVIPNMLIVLTSLDPAFHQESWMVALRYASVLAQFGEVENAEQMEGLLEAVALPVGSSSIKRKSTSNLSLNAYVGFAGGVETAVSSNSSLKQTRGSLGLSAPIGVAYSFYSGKRSTINSKTQPVIPSLTIFASAFDIGNIVNARLGSDTSSLGELKFSHFISLGLGAYINFRNSPFTLGVGYSYTPSYRDFKPDDKTWVYNADAYRVRLSFLVDIPILNFYTRKNDSGNK